jgi:hypothetical protein
VTRKWSRGRAEIRPAFLRDILAGCRKIDWQAKGLLHRLVNY